VRIALYGLFFLVVLVLAVLVTFPWDTLARRIEEEVARSSPGTVLAADEQGIDVATAEGVLRLERLQKAGGKPLQASEFLRGFAIAPGQCFDAKAAP
jgi:methionyl-tRNA formyltransferase